jgi:hypothetical protein
MGGFTSRGNAPRIAQRLGQSATVVTGNLTIGNRTIGAGSTEIIRATGTVTINGDIRYANNVPFGRIPQMVIIARDIDIRSNVTNIDAWLIATGAGSNGRINTCSNAPASLTSNICNNQLQVNGPVIANRLDLRRTAGSGTGDASGEPAEVFNLRADAYLWAYRQASAGSRAQTVFTTELPPRF